MVKFAFLRDRLLVSEVDFAIACDEPNESCALVITGVVANKSFLQRIAVSD